ncbi:LLM class flavin-dependent oxidoreductase [Leucobacter soli]
MSIVPKPVQSPMPPLWNVGDSDDSIRFAARESMGAITWLLSDKSLPRMFELYRDESSAHGVERRLGEDLGLLRVCVVAPTDAEARALAEPSVERLYRDYLGGLRGRSIYADPGEVLGSDVDDVSWFDFLDERGHLLVGSPETVTAHLKQYEDTVGLERILLLTWLPALTSAQIQESLRLFGAEVMPHFRTEEA